MKCFDQFERLKRMHKLIKMQSTGRPADFAAKLSICQSYLHKLISEMKEEGAPIDYSINNQTYFYTEDYDLTIGK
jgi:hypothetical protein